MRPDSLTTAVFDAAATDLELCNADRSRTDLWCTHTRPLRMAILREAAARRPSHLLSIVRDAVRVRADDHRDQVVISLLLHICI